jgi:hypothetical protein
MHVFILTDEKMRSLRYKISNNPKLNDVLSCSFKYIVFSQSLYGVLQYGGKITVLNILFLANAKIQGLKVLLQLFNN